MLPRMGHVAMWFDPKNEVETQSRNWFGRWLKRDDAVAAR
jgi:hypothetical protein